MQKFYFLFLFLNIHIFSQSYTVCDSDYDGIYNFSEVDKSNIINLINQQNFGDAEVYITVATKGVLKVIDPLTNPKIETVCNSISNFTYYFEIAVNSNKEVFITTSTQNEIFKIDENNCNYSSFPINVSGYIQSMSFDNKDNLYVGDGSSNVYRADKGNLSNFYVWNNFTNGQPSGDFVMLNGKMYISWAFGSVESKNYLFEVTLDKDNKYIAHKNLGQIKDATYGLASEYGTLYAVTPNELYKINLEDLSTQTVIKNDSPNNEWFGAAGKHEAYNLNYHFYDSEENAKNQNAELIFPYTNTKPFKQIIFLRINNLAKSTFTISPIELNVNIPPKNNLKATYIVCNNGYLSNIEINTLLSEETYSFKWYFNNELINQNSSKLITNKSGIYTITITNIETGCFSKISTTVKQSDIFINNIDFSPTQINISASGTDYPFKYCLNENCQDSPNFYQFPLGEISIFAKNSNKCLSENFKKILIPNNVLTPNGDGINDYFTFNYPLDSDNYKISILDRFGKVLINSKIDKNFKWEGKDRSGNSLPTGTYWYIISLNGIKKYSAFIFLRNR